MNKIIELIGMPRAGKSCARDAIQQVVEAGPKRNYSNAMSYSASIDRYAAQRLIRAGLLPGTPAFCYGIAAQIFGHSIGLFRSQVMVHDRGLTDQLVWLRTYGFDDSTVRTWLKALESKNHYLKILFVQPAELSMERHQAGEEKEKVDDGIMDNLPLLQSLEAGYRQLADSSDVDLVIDGTDPLEQNLEWIREAVRDFLEEDQFGD